MDHITYRTNCKKGGCNVCFSLINVCSFKKVSWHSFKIVKLPLSCNRKHLSFMWRDTRFFLCICLFLKNGKNQLKAENFQRTWTTAKIDETGTRRTLPQLSVNGDVVSVYHSTSSVRTFLTAIPLTPGVRRKLSSSFWWW